VLGIFRTNQILILLLLIPYLLVLHAGHLSGVAVPAAIQEGYLGFLLSDYTSQLATGWLVGISILLIVVEAIQVALIVNSNRLGQNIDLLPGLFYALFVCLIPESQLQLSLLIGNFFLLLAISTLFRCYRNAKAADLIFNSGLWIGMASLFYPSYLLLLLWPFLSLSSLRSFRVQEFYMVLFGAITPFLLLGTGLWWVDSFQPFFQIQWIDAWSFFDIRTVGSPLLNSLKLGLMGLILLIVIANSGSFLIKKGMEAQVKTQSLFWLMLLTALPVLVQHLVYFPQFITLAPTLGLFLGLWFSGLPRRWAEIGHLLLFLFALALQFSVYWFPTSG
jgi:hypothetical protein